MDDLEYWEEMVGESFCQNDIEYDSSKVKLVAKDMSAAHEHYDQAFYQPPVSEHPVFSELESLKKQLANEKSKVTCRVCAGTGQTRDAVGTSHVAISSCWKCDGQGRHL